MSRLLTRRGLIVAGAGALAGCDALNQNSGVRGALSAGEALSHGAQRALMAGQPLAREFRASDMSRQFKVNGTASPESEQYHRLAAGQFADWRLKVSGLVANPLSLSLADLQALPARAQITRHDCVEGWSAIGQWKGPRLGRVLRLAGLRPEARYIVFHCADALEPGPLGQYYESIDLFDAFHPQTILAHEMNGAPLTIGHGAPVRLRVERQLGYKHAKYVMGVEAVAGFAHIGKGRGGFWEDRGYEWYAGI